MANPPEFILEILKGKKITEYLESKGITPSRVNERRMSYRCPLHAGDNDPSFFVMLDGDYQKFKCFGCNEYGDVINLYSIMENVSLREAVIALAKELNISGKDFGDNIQQYLVNVNFEDSYSMEEVNLLISRFCFEHIKKYNFMSSECIYADSIFKRVDDIIHSGDKDRLNNAYEFILDYTIPNRIHKLEEKKNGS